MPPLPLYNDEKPSPIDTKSELDALEEKHDEEMIPQKKTRFITRLVAAILVLYFAIYPLAELAAANVRRNCGQHAAGHLKELGGLQRLGQGVDVKEHKRVPLEAHIMSKCPDARDCLQKLVLPTMQRVSEKVDFKLSYIGT